MGFTYKVNFSPQGLKLKAQLDPKILQGALLDEIEEIKERTQYRQQAVDGSPLPQLSPAYKKRKIESGRRGVPDRHWTGTLLGAIHSKVTGIGARLEGLINFTDSAYAKGGASVRQVAQAMQNLKPFFGLNSKQVEAIKDAIRKGLSNG